MAKSNKSTSKKNVKVTEEEFDDIFDGDEELDEESFEDDSEDGDEEFEDDESEDEEDEEFEEEESDEDFEEDDELDEDIDDAVEAGLSENANGVTAEAFEEFRVEISRRLDNIETLLRTTAKPGTGSNPVPNQVKTVKSAKAIEAEADAPKRGRGRPPGSGKKVESRVPPSPPVKTKGAAKPAATKGAASAAGSSVKQKDAAVILAAMNQKDDRKGTDATKFARLLSKKKFEGRVSEEAILNWLKENKHVFGSGAKENTFKR